MSDAFGALTDHWGLLGSDQPLFGKAKLIAAPKDPVAQNRTDAEDEVGDIGASAFHGNTAGELFTAGCTYQLLPGQSVNLNTIKIGELATGKLIDNANVTTQNNGGNPTLEFSGMLGTEAIIKPAAGATQPDNTFTLPDLTITGAMRAQAIGFTVDAGKLTGSSLTASLSMEQQEDGVGEPVAHGIRGGTVEVSADFVRITDAPAWTVASPFTETKAPGVDEGQAAWHTATATAAGTLTRDTSAL